MDHLYKGQKGLCKNKKSKLTKPTPQAMSDLHPLNNNKIIIIIKVYENKRTPGNLGIKRNTPNPKLVSDVKSSGVFWEEQENVLGEN